jgi:hypothetical protein
MWGEIGRTGLIDSQEREQPTLFDLPVHDIVGCRDVYIASFRVARGADLVGHHFAA